MLPGSGTTVVSPLFAYTKCGPATGLKFASASPPADSICSPSRAARSIVLIVPTKQAKPDWAVTGLDEPRKPNQVAPATGGVPNAPPAASVAAVVAFGVNALKVPI